MVAGEGVNSYCRPERNLEGYTWVVLMLYCLTFRRFYGRAETDRITDPFEGVREGVNSMYPVLKSRVGAALAALGTSVTVNPARTFFSVAGLAINPVTNV